MDYLDRFNEEGELSWPKTKNLFKKKRAELRIGGDF